MRVRPLITTAVSAALVLAVATPAALAAPTGASSGSTSAATTTTASSTTSPRTTKPTKTTLATIRAVAGKAVTVTATVSPSPTGGTVAFADGAKTVCTASAVKSGRATCSMTFAAGNHTVTAKYSGKSGGYGASSATQKVSLAAPGSIVGSLGTCTTSTGALVAVDFAHWGGPVVRGCGDPLPATGLSLLTKAGFTTAGTQHDGPAFVCRIGSPSFAGGTQYPTPAQDACVVTPPASAYWSFWVAKKGATTWSYGTLGAASYKPTDGEVEAWTYGATDVGGTTGQPAVTPAAVRAGLPAAASRKGSGDAAPAPTRAADPRPATVQPRAAVPSGATPDVDRGVGYLTSTANLAGGSHYEPFGPGFTDFGLTMDGALALAAAGTDDAALKKITDYVAANGDSFTGIGTDYASGGSIGKEALLAEVTGHDPRNFGGHDLIAALDDLACTSAVTSVCEAGGNYRYAASTFSQSLGVLAQLRAGDTSGAAKPLAYLEGRQHDSGAFPSVIPGSDSEVDSTAMAAMALAAAPAASGDVDKALAWVAAQQNPDGGFPGAAGDSTNSAALAVQALTLAGSKYDDVIAKGLAFLAARQNSDGGFDVALDADGSDLRASAQAVGGAVGTPFTTLTDDIATPAPDLDVAAGADYLVKQLTDGTHLEYDGGYGPNYGGTADIALALAAAGGHDDALVKIVKYLVAHVDDYVDPEGKAEFPGPFTGAAAKLAVLAESTGQDPADFGGVDLLTVLTDHVCAAADATGACTAAGDFYQAFSVTSQALGVLALARAGVRVPPAALQRLADLQDACGDGGYPSLFPTAGAACTSEVDTTGFVAQALALVPAAADRLQRAIAYLRGAQTDNGGFPGAAGINTNSTALAVMALLAAPASADAGVTKAAALALRPAAAPSDPGVKEALRFLAGLQNSDGGFGISADSRDSDERATAQSVPAAALTSLSSLLHPVSLTAAPGGGPSGGGGSGSTGGGSTTGSPSSGTSDSASGLADTGVRTGELLAWALALLLAGSGLLSAGRRRLALSTGRHRSEG